MNILKIGGNVIDNERELDTFLSTVVKSLAPCILIHGGGKIATEISKKLGIEPQMVDGRRITDKDTLDIAVMVYGGLLNKKIVAKLQALQVNALGFTGADANIISADKRPVKDIDYGYVGDIKSVDASFLRTCLSLNISPILASLSHDNHGNLLNTNADTIAAFVAIEAAKYEEVQLLYCFEKKGVLTDTNNDNSVVHHLDENLYNSMINNGSIHKGMKPKLENAFLAKRAGVHKVFICHAFSALDPRTGTEIV